MSQVLTKATADVVRRDVALPPIRIATFDELMRREKEIVARIATVRNGGHLFLADPFRLLAEIGVELATAAQAEIVRLEPQLQGFSGPAYDAVKRAPDQPVTFNVRGLFRGSRLERAP